MNIFTVFSDFFKVPKDKKVEYILVMLLLGSIWMCYDLYEKNSQLLYRAIKSEGSCDSSKMVLIGHTENILNGIINEQRMSVRRSDSLIGVIVEQGKSINKNENTINKLKNEVNF